VLGLRLYTGPAFMAINGSLRFAHYKKGKKDCLPEIDPLLPEHFFTGASRTVTALKTALLQGYANLSIGLFLPLDRPLFASR
jgi:hypothetical protein